MLESITGETLASEVEMVRTSFKGAILIVEGENDDNFISRFIDDTSCNIIIAFGKENAITAIQILNTEGREGILAFVDSDFWIVDGYNPGLPNLIATELNDTESMIFNSLALNRVVKEYCSKTKVEKIGDLRAYVIDRASSIGILRLASSRRSLNLVFKCIDYGKITEKNCIDINLESLVRHICQLTAENRKKKGIAEKVPTDNEIMGHYQAVFDSTKTSDKNLLCCGHDIMGLFAIGLKRLIGSLTAAVADHDNVEKVFRLAYDSADFLATSVANSISEWEKANNTYKILRQD